MLEQEEPTDGGAEILLSLLVTASLALTGIIHSSYYNVAADEPHGEPHWGGASQLIGAARELWCERWCERSAGLATFAITSR